MRKTLEESWRFLESMGHEMPRRPDGAPHLPDRMPNFDDDTPVNIAFFRTLWQDADLSNLTLPRMFLARSEFKRVNFRCSEFTESRMCWNDFIECDFSSADLRRCDMRSSNFRKCTFRGADLANADLRISLFEGCTFDGAVLTHAIADLPSAKAGLRLSLNELQRRSVKWAKSPGEVPPGG